MHYTIHITNFLTNLTHMRVWMEVRSTTYFTYLYKYLVYSQKNYSTRSPDTKTMLRSSEAREDEEGGAVTGREPEKKETDIN